MSKELDALQEICDKMGLSLINPESNQTAVNYKKRRADLAYERCINYGLYYMAQIKKTRWRGKDKQNFISALQQKRAQIRTIKNKGGDRR